GVSFTVHKGETLAIVGESGSGKSVTTKALMRLLPKRTSVIKRGEILFEGEDLVRKSSKEMQKIRGQDIAMIFQDPMTSLNPTMKIGNQIMEGLLKHRNMSRHEAKTKDIQKETDSAIIFITHDLGVVANIADRVAVMYAGKIVEIGTTAEIFYNPKHPYTWGLLGSMPTLDDTDEDLLSIPGSPPDMLNPPKGDAFAPRNPYALKIDAEMEPPMFKVSDTHYAATWLLHEDAPKVEPPQEVKRRMAGFSQTGVLPNVGEGEQK